MTAPLKETPTEKKPTVVNSTTPDSTVMTMGRLRAEGKGIYTSEGANYNNALFGRDSAISTRELLDQDPVIAYEAIRMLASLQGVKHHWASDEEPGRIHHEYRELSKWQAPLVTKERFRLISMLWGGSRKVMTTYFSMDSTPLYVLLVSDYAAKDKSILNETVIRRDGKKVTIARTLEDAGRWMSSHITRSGLVEVTRRNPTSLIHQTWKDSPTGYIREDGDSLNLSKPIAYLEVQGLAAEALQRISHLVPKSKYAKQFSQTSKKAFQTLIDRFWIPDRHFFASAIDYDDHGKQRRIDVLQSDPGWILQTSVFDHLPEEEKIMYIAGIVRGLFSSDFLTDAGLRTRSLQYAGMIDMVDYHGSLVTWPIDTYMAAKGLRRQGLPRLANQLESRILNAVTMAGNCYEFFFVDTDGKVLLNPEKSRYARDGDRQWPVQMLPDSNIAWTVASVLSMKYARTKRTLDIIPQNGSWQKALEDDVLSKMKQISVVKTLSELRQNRLDQPHIHVYQSHTELFREVGKTIRRKLGRALSWRFRPNYK